MKAHASSVAIFWTLVTINYSLTNDINFNLQLPTQENLLFPAVGYFFAHGLGATQDQAALFVNKEIIGKPLITFDFPDALNNFMKYYPEEVNLGQEADIKRLEQAYLQGITTLPGYRFIMSGISRGAVAIFNIMATQFEALSSSAVALVLESPFDTIKNVIRHLLQRFYVSWVPFSDKIAFSIMKKNFPLINPHGIFPMKVVNQMPPSLPILIIHSMRDRTIPINCSRNLYKALIQAGHNDIYLFELASGEHGKLAIGPESDLYRNVVHAFYKKYKLPHDTNYALAGSAVLRLCQPTIQEINKRIVRNRSPEPPYEEDNNILFDMLNISTLDDSSVSSVIDATFSSFTHLDPLPDMELAMLLEERQITDNAL